jgi:protein gp37
VADRSAIEWTEATWNPVTGCDRVLPGCDHCYAMTLAKRLKAMGSEKYQNDGDPRTSGPGFGLPMHPKTLDEPYRWHNPRVVFVNSMSDLSVGVGATLRVISPGHGRYLCAQQVSFMDVIGLEA